MSSGALSTWKTKDGRIIPIEEMTEEHLINTVKMWRTNVHMYRNKIIAYETKRGGRRIVLRHEEVYGVQVFLGGETGMLLGLDDDDFLQATFPVYRDLLWECIFRGLMDADTGEWLRQPSLGEVDISNQLDLVRRISEKGNKDGSQPLNSRSAGYAQFG